MKWKLWYDDRSTFSYEDGDFSKAPYRGVICLVTEDDRVGREIDNHHGPRFADFYLWWPGAPKPWAVDWAGLLDYLLEKGYANEHARLSDLSLSYLRDAGVKLGRSVPNELFDEIFQQASNDPDFPPKSAKTPRGT